MKKIQLMLSLALMISSGVVAQDRYFARTYTSDVLPKGRVDLELWHTSRFGHKGQFYHGQDQRMEVEIGLGKNLQTAVYFNRFQTRYSEGSEGTVLDNQIGFSNEWKWKLRDPAAHKLGVSLYGEWGLKGGDELELETKLILDKIFGKNLLAFNAVYEYEREFEWSNNKVESGKLQTAELDLGYQYFLKPGLGVGLELVNTNKISDEHGWEYAVLFGGPTLNFKKDKWFIILNYLPQLGNLHQTVSAPAKKVLDDHERVEARFIVGISL